MLRSVEGFAQWVLSMAPGGAESAREEHGASLSMAQRRVLTAIEVCRTAVLDGHLEQCDHCAHRRNAYNSCSDRHCPKCQSLARAQWLEDRQAELLNTQYFTLCSLYRNRLQPLPIRIRESSTASCSRPRRRPCSPSPLIPSAWAQRSDFSLYSILGI
jgi:Transposase zinc-binding domain